MKRLLSILVVIFSMSCCGGLPLQTGLSTIAQLIEYVASTIIPMYTKDRAVCDVKAEDDIDIYIGCTEIEDGYAYVIAKRNQAEFSVNKGRATDQEEARIELQRAIDEFVKLNKRLGLGNY
jgi:hypothetical protein